MREPLLPIPGRSVSALPLPSIGPSDKGIAQPTQSGGREGFLSDVIVELGFADRPTVEQAVRAARSPGATVASVLLESGALTEDQLAHAQAERHGLPYVDLDVYEVDAAAANLVTPQAARQARCVPVGHFGPQLVLAVADPADAAGAGMLAGLAGRNTIAAVACGPALDDLIARLPLPQPAGELEAVEDPAAPEPPPEEPAPLAAPEPPRENPGLREELTEAGARLEEVIDDRGEGRLQGDGYVHPELQGRGVGSRLVDLYEQRAGGVEGARTIETAALRGDGAADALFTGRGYEPVRHFYRMLIELDGEPEPPVWPDGLTVGRLDVERDGEAFHAAIVEAFAEEWGFQIRPWDEFREWRFGAEAFDPSLCPVVKDGDEIAALSLNDRKANGDWGWINLLAVRPRWRRLGLGEALLRESFREFHRRGERRVALAVDVENPTGATRLYERVGMRPLWEAVVYRKQLP